MNDSFIISPVWFAFDMVFSSLFYFIKFQFLQYALYFLLVAFFSCLLWLINGSLFVIFFYFLLVLHHTFLLSNLLNTYFRVFYYLLCSSNIGVLFHLLLILLYGLLPFPVFPPKNAFSVLCTFGAKFQSFLNL